MDIWGDVIIYEKKVNLISYKISQHLTNFK